MVEPLVVSPSGVDAIALGDNAAFEHNGALVQYEGIGAGEVGRSLAFVRDPRFVGTGFFAGEAPDGLTTVYGDPIPADVFVYWRDPDDPMAQEVLVGATKSAPDGTWLITGLNYNLRYVVRARASGRDDVTVVGVQPSRSDVIAYVDQLVPREDEFGDVDGLTGHVLLDSGLPPFTCEVIQPLPYGLSARVDGRKLLIEGVSTDNGLWESVVRVTASNGSSVDVPVSVLIAGPPRFWRIKMTEDTWLNAGYRVVQIAELQFNGLQATGGTPMASSSEEGDSSFGLAKAFDGNKSGNTIWGSTNTGSTVGQWLGYEFSSCIAVESVEITVRNHSAIASSWSPKSFDVESSTDGVTWKKEWSVTGQGAWRAAETRTFYRP